MGHLCREYYAISDKHEEKRYPQYFNDLVKGNRLTKRVTNNVTARW